jgi:tetratricopeptide (TPR) repeat protein
MAERAGAILRDKLFHDRGDEGTPLWRSTSDEAQLLEQEARIAIRELRYREAIEKLEKAIALDPTFILARVRLAEALESSGYGARARESADRAMRDIDGLGADAAQSSFAPKLVRSLLEPMLAWMTRSTHAAPSSPRTVTTRRRTWRSPTP